jgi:hypothetical protein
MDLNPKTSAADLSLIKQQKNRIAPIHQMNEPKDIIEKFRQKIIGFVSYEDISRPLSFLIGALPQNACLLIIGGALRNFIIKQVYGNAPPTRDIDMLISGLGKEYSIQKILTGEKFKNTDFGGVRWYPKDSAYSFDLSLLDNFLPIEKFHLEPDIDNLLATIDFDVNALIFEVKSSHFYEKSAIEAIKDKTIGFNAKKTYDKGFLAYRLLLIRHKIGFYPSREAFRFLRSGVDLDMTLWIKKTLESKVGKELCENILADYDRICLYKNYEDYKKQETLPEYLKHINITDQEIDSYE